jgi:hypothetical protein
LLEWPSLNGPTIGASSVPVKGNFLVCTNKSPVTVVGITRVRLFSSDVPRTSKKTDVLARRDLKDFPPVAWFTRRIDIPRCLLKSSLFLIKEGTGERVQLPTEDDEAVANMVALNRLALGFRVADIPVVPWPEHRGYKSGEGQELNESAREAGDDPDDWYVADEPVDVLKISEFWFSRTKSQPKLRRFDQQMRKFAEW